jgi:glycine cleavage system H protein
LATAGVCEGLRQPHGPELYPTASVTQLPTVKGKHTMSYSANYRYTKSHQWVLLEGKTASVGITDYAQDTLGDIKFVELPNIGQAVMPDAAFGSIESVKSVSDVFSPISGEIIEVNETLKSQPELLNQSANETWIIKVAVNDESAADTLSAAEYERFIAEERP